jgi:hypothetical protein
LHLEDGQEKVIATCVPSNTVFAHQYNDENCAMTHDDQNKKSNIMGKTFIHDDKLKTNVTISECRSVQKIDYKQVASKASVNIGHTKDLIIADQDKNSSHRSVAVKDLRSLYPNTWLANPKYPDREDTSCYALDKNLCITRALINTERTKEYCVSGIAKTPWTTRDGIVINHEKSDEKPVWDISIKNTGENHGGYFVEWYVSNCGVPRCSTSYVTEHPTYMRADGTLYLDKDKIERDYYICGTGKNLNAIKQTNQ